MNFDLQGGVNASEEDGVTYLKEDKTPEAVMDTNAEMAPLAGFIHDQFTRAKDARLRHETRWLTCYRNFRGLYGSSTQFRDNEKSRVFIKVTKTKVLAAYGQLLEVLFSVPNKIPISVEPSERPLGIAEAMAVDPSASNGGDDTKIDDSDKGTIQDIYGYPGDGKDLPPGATLASLLGPLKTKLKGLSVKLGYAKTPQQITVEPAEYAANKMDRTIQSQLGDSDASTVLRHAVFECALLGTGVIKGPFTATKTYNRWTVDEDSGDRKYDPIIKDIPMLEPLSVWNVYPDPDARTPKECEYVIERYKLSRTQLRALKDRPFFRGSAIDRLIDLGPNYVRQYWETELEDKAAPNIIQRWEVLEYWGVIDKSLIENSEFDLPEDTFKDVDEVQMNIWISGNEILRCTLNPLKPIRLPFFIFPYEINPYQVFGIGVAENMEDSQMVMNGHMRMAIDNLALSGNVVFEVDESNLVPGQDMSIYPGKIFRRQGGAPGQAIFATKFNDTSQNNLAMFDKARQLADESTGIQSYSYGQTGVGGTNRTASGMSMLMGASALNIKTVIKNIDDYLLRPMGEALFNWNMQFNPDEEIKGDLEIKANGTASLMQKEVRSQRLTQFMQTVGSNPAIAPLVKWSTLLREMAQSMDIDPEKFINNPDEANIQALLMRNASGNTGMGQTSGGNTLSGSQSPGSQAGPSPMGGQGAASDSQGSGGGTIGTGSVPVPGQTGFSANNGQA